MHLFCNIVVILYATLAANAGHQTCSLAQKDLPKLVPKHRQNVCIFLEDADIIWIDFCILTDLELQFQAWVLQLKRLGIGVLSFKA